MADNSVSLFNPNDGLTGRDGGPYLDQEEARIAEERRARVEGRKPNYDEPGVTAGIPLTTAAQMIHNVNVSSVPSKGGVNWVNEAQGMFDRAVSDDNTALQPVDKINKDVVEEMQKEDEQKDTEPSDFHPDDPNAPVERMDDDVSDDSNSDEGQDPQDVSDDVTGDTLGFTADDDLNLDDLDDKAKKSEADPKNTSSNTSPKSTSRSGKTSK